MASFAPLSNHVLCPKCEHRCPSPQGFVWFLVFSLENKCSHTGLPSFPKPSESTWSTEDDPSVGPLRHHLNELWHYSQFFMWQAFVLLCEMLACCGFVCWKNTFHLVCLKIHCDSFKVIIIHSPASEDTNRGADSSNYMFIMDQSSHRHIPHRAVYSHDSTILFQGLFGDILLLFALDIIVLFSWTDWKATCT